MLQECLIPFERLDVEHQRARCVGVVRLVHFAARKFPKEPSVDRAEGKLALFGLFTRTLHMVENPLDLRAREVGVDDEARLLLELLDEPLALQILAYIRCLARLPDDGVVDRPSRRPVPDDRRLALVCDADGGDVTRDESRLLESFSHDFVHGAPDLFRVVLDPAGLREVLRELLLRDADDLGIHIEDDGAVARRAGVKRHDVFLSHIATPFRSFLDSVPLVQRRIAASLGRPRWMKLCGDAFFAFLDDRLPSG